MHHQVTNRFTINALDPSSLLVCSTLDIKRSIPTVQHTRINTSSHTTPFKWVVSCQNCTKRSTLQHHEVHFKIKYEGRETRARLNTVHELLPQLSHLAFCGLVISVVGKTFHNGSSVGKTKVYKPIGYVSTSMGYLVTWSMIRH